MRDTLRVMHVLAPAPFGGLESVVRGLAGGHAVRGHDVHVITLCTPDEGAESFEAALAEAGVTVHRITTPSRRYFREHQRVSTQCAALRPDVVHTHGMRADVVAGWSARCVGLPTITTVHGFTGASRKLQVYERLQVMMLSTFDAVIAVSQPLVQQLARRRVPRERLHLVPNAWTETRRALPRTEARRRLGIDPAQRGTIIGWVGRLSPEKGADILIEALAQIPDRHVLVAMVGDGPRRADLEALASNLGLADRVRWCGPIAGAAAIFSAFDVFVLSSRTEGTPIVLFEAMSARIPIVATRVGGVPDVLARGTALVVAPDDPAGLARAIRETVNEPRAAAARAAAAQDHLRTNHPADAWLTRYEALYDSIRRPARVAVAV
jgi:glycosyltransferase involved in cell wall biosynthesis